VDGDLPAAPDALRAIGAAQQEPGLRNRRNAEADYLTSNSMANNVSN
jgi:GH24 family phage-related lysozyme (muramidase)